MVNPKKISSDPDDFIDGEVVSEYEGETFLNLPPVPDTDQSLARPVNYDTGRRDFVLRMMVGGAAALALGGSAALLVSQNRAGNTTEVIVPYGAGTDGGQISGDLAQLAQRIGDLEQQLAAMQFERDQAISDLNVSNTRAVELQAQLDAALAQLQEAQGLNGLWQSLDDVGLDSIVASALTLVGGALNTMMDVLAVVQAGVSAGQTALTKFVQSMPGARQGIQWLQQRVTALSNDLEWLTGQVEQAVEPVEPFVTLIEEFVVWVLGHLPFIQSDRARAGLEAMKTVVGGLPAFVEGINSSVLNPLASWFGDDKSKNLTGTLVDPMQNQVLTPTKDLTAKVTSFKMSYQEQFAVPAAAALDERTQIREQIKSAQAHLGWVA
jgi:hypothetical protein